MNLIGAYIVSIFLIGLLFRRPSIREGEDSFKASPIGAHLALIVLMLVLLVQEATIPNGVFDSIWPLSALNYVFDTVNLLIHEAGHIYWGWGSDVLMSLGGTLNEIAFPLVPAVLAYRRNCKFIFSLCLCWFAHNCFGISRYIADAQSMSLPLVGGGSHDWNIVLGNHSLLKFDSQIAQGVFTLAVLSSLASLLVYSLEMKKGSVSNYTQVKS